MTRRSNRKVSNLSSYTEVDENDSSPSPIKVEGKKTNRNAVICEVVEAHPKSPDSSTPKEKRTPIPMRPTIPETIGTVAKAMRISPSIRKTKSEVAIKDDEDVPSAILKTISASPKQAKGKRGVVKEEEDLKTQLNTQKLNKKKRKAEDDEDQDKAEILTDVKKVKKNRKTTKEKEAEAMPLAARTVVQTLKRAMYIGAHVSGAGGVHNSVTNAVHIGGNSFALFLKSQRKWVSPPLAPDARDQFHALSKEHNFDQTKHVVPHGSYLVNLAQPDREKAQQAYSCFLDDLQRCESLSINLYNFHPGNTGPHLRSEAIARIAANLNKAHKATKTVVTLLENMAGAGNTIGSAFEDLRDIIALVENKSRVGVCLDTCHSFAAGYDLRSPEAFKKTMETFASVVGIKYLKALHLNDSKAPFSSNRDVHANIGTGFLGLRAFHNVVNFEPFQHLPMVLETPIERKGEDGKMFEDKNVWATEIKLLEGLIGVSTDSDEFKANEQRLQDLGADERKKFQQQVDKKIQKGQKTIDSMFKSKLKANKKVEAEGAGDSGSDSEGKCNH